MNYQIHETQSSFVVTKDGVAVQACWSRCSAVDYIHERVENFNRGAKKEGKSNA